VKAYVGVTDGDWYRFLAARRLDEVNFWRPGGGRRFAALQIGEPFLFKTHSPHNRVVGGGFYSSFAALRASEAWAMFGEANGVPSLEALLQRVSMYRRQPLGLQEDPEIGCVFVRDVVFFADEMSVVPPPDFASNLVQGRTYDVAQPAYRPYFDLVFSQLLGHEIVIDPDTPWHLSGPVYGDPRLAPYRLGQRSFQAAVMDAYDYRCAVTGDRIRPVLQAAHILPLPKGGENRLDNGLLLRSDVHTLFDRGYLGIDPNYRLAVSPRLRDEFANGDEFYARESAGVKIDIPSRRLDRPAREFLEWHLDDVFLAS
jgi:putative restriction endonuclease